MILGRVFQTNPTIVYYGVTPDIVNILLLFIAIMLTQVIHLKRISFKVTK